MKINNKTSTWCRDIRLRMIVYAEKCEEFVAFGLNYIHVIDIFA